VRTVVSLTAYENAPRSSYESGGSCAKTLPRNESLTGVPDPRYFAHRSESHIQAASIRVRRLPMYWAIHCETSDEMAMRCRRIGVTFETRRRMYDSTASRQR
jgi:hypothetical protein